MSQTPSRSPATMPGRQPHQPPADERRPHRRGRRRTGRRAIRGRRKSTGSPSRAAAGAAAPAGEHLAHPAHRVPQHAARPRRGGPGGQRRGGSGGQRRGGPVAGRIPRPPISAASAMKPAATANAPRSENTTMSRPPTGLAATCATWTAIRISDRAGTYAASATTARTSAPWVALASPLAKPAAGDQRQQHAHRQPGQRHHRGQGRGGQRSRRTRSRRGGTRSTRLDSSVPVTRNGKNPSANDSDDSSGEWVRS